MAIHIGCILSFLYFFIDLIWRGNKQVLDFKNAAVVSDFLPHDWLTWKLIWGHHDKHGNQQRHNYKG